MLLLLLYGAALAAYNFTRTDGGDVIRTAFDEASTWYLQVVFFEVVSGVIIGFLIVYKVLRKYGKQFTYE